MITTLSEESWPLTSFRSPSDVAITAFRASCTQKQRLHSLYSSRCCCGRLRIGAKTSPSFVDSMLKPVFCFSVGRASQQQCCRIKFHRNNVLFIIRRWKNIIQLNRVAFSLIYIRKLFIKRVWKPAMLVSTHVRFLLSLIQREYA